MDQISPSVLNTTLEERKRMREFRLKQRLAAAEKLISNLDRPELLVKKSLLEQTIDISNERLLRTFMEGNNLVTNIRVSSDTKELERRGAEAAAKDLRMKVLDEEANLALNKMTAIINKWESLGHFNDPLNMCQGLKEQRSRCEELIRQKDCLIDSLKNELKIADERYASDRLDMLEDVSILARRIDEQVSVMKKSYLHDIDHIEEAVEDSRNMLLSEQKVEWQNLYEKRELNEVSNLADRFALMEKNEEEISDVHIIHSEKYREAKIRLDTNIQILEQELEQIKALCLINSEKLDYNYQVLKKREDENIIVKNNQKRNLNKLQDEVFRLKKKIMEKNRMTKLEITQLDEELCRLHKNIVDIEKKADHFSEVNDKKFIQIWNMKTCEAQDLLNKIQSADKEIHENILGEQWIEPELKPLRIEDLVSFQAASVMIREVFQQQSDSLDLLPSGLSAYAEFDVTGKNVLTRILGLISDHSEFLVEEMLDDILKPYSPDERTLVRLDNVFNAIGVSKKEEIEIMQGFFLPFAQCSVCKAPENGCEDFSTKITTKEECIRQQHDFTIERVNVLKALRNLVLRLSSSKLRQKSTDDVHLAKDRCTMSRWLSREDMDAYWTRFREIFSTDENHLWDALLNGLNKYHSLLQERQKMQYKAQKLMEQNKELRGLVEKYLPAKQ